MKRERFGTSLLKYLQKKVNKILQKKTSLKFIKKKEKNRVLTYFYMRKVL